MDTQLLNSFLLATAQEPWEIWWPSTRLILADFLDESGEEAKALALRTMECVVADEFDGLGKHLWQWEFSSAQQSREFATLSIYRKNASIPLWQRTHDFYNSFLVYERPPDTPIIARDLVISAVLPDGMSIDYIFRFSDGHWQGTLSLDRAQRRCRRRVLEMFSEWLAQWRRKDFLAICTDDSPRWVPFEAQPFTEFNRRIAEREILNPYPGF